jgi:hypothetical protein
MEITRLQPFPLVFSHPDFIANTNYVLAILDDHATDLVEIFATSNSGGVITVNLPDYFSRYDDEYRGEIYLRTGTNTDGTAIRGSLVWIDTITITRPYVDPDILADTPEDTADAVMYEAIARAIINSITGGFMYKREVIETTGLGADYLALPFRLNKIVQVYENGVLVYDAEPTDPDWKNVREYYISPDKGAISVNMPSSYGINRMQSKPVRGPKGASDSFTLYNTNDSPNFSDAIYDTKTFVDLASNSAMFPNGWDYTVIVDAGWPIIPQDIKQATMLIVNDLKCNNIPYINSYIKDYKSDQFTLSFADGVFKDTGNRIADKILSAYVRPIYRLGVL